MLTAKKAEVIYVSYPVHKEAIRRADAAPDLTIGSDPDVAALRGGIRCLAPPYSPEGCAAIAAALEAEVAQRDVGFICKHWVTTPIFYSFPADEHSCVRQRYAAALERDPAARVWVLGFDDIPMPPRVTAALAHFRIERRVSAGGVYADLYLVRSTSRSPARGASASETFANRRVNRATP